MKRFTEVMRIRAPRFRAAAFLFCWVLTGFAASWSSAQNCNPNKKAKHDAIVLARRDDVKRLPAPLKDRLVELARRQHTFLPLPAFAEADSPSQLFQYYLLDTTSFEPNVFTATIPGINDGVPPTAANGSNCGLPTIGAVRQVLEPKEGLPTDPNDPGSFLDVFTDISSLFVINNESGWYEGWMIWDLRVAGVADPRPDGHAQFGKITAADAALLQQIGAGNNATAGALFTLDGNAVRFPSANDHFPDPATQSNLVPLYLSMGAYNCLQQSDCHSYWEFNQYTNWVHPLYELPFTGGFPSNFGQPPNAFEQGNVGKLSSLIPGSGPSGVKNAAVDFGDNPNSPRDPDRALDFPTDGTTNDDHKEIRVRFIPSGLAKEILIDAFERRASFEPAVTDLETRLNDAYAHEVSLIDTNGDGVVDFVEADTEGTSDGGQSNDRLFIPATKWNRFAVTREINDGYLAPRFATSQRAWVLSGALVSVNPTVSASIKRDGDDR